MTTLDEATLREAAAGLATNEVGEPGVERAAPLDDYAPYALSDDAAEFGLRRSSIRTALGPVEVHHDEDHGDHGDHDHDGDHDHGHRRGDRRAESSRTALILLHGAAGSWTTWTPMLRAAADSGHPLRDLVVPDLPGWGASAAPHDRSLLSVESLADAVAEVATALGYSRWRIVGHSLGAVVAAAVAARHRGSTVSVGLIAPSGAAVRAVSAHPLGSFALLPWFGGMLVAMRVLAVFGVVGTGLVRALGRAGAFSALLSPLLEHPALVHRSVSNALAREIRPAAFVLAATRLVDYDASGAWSRIVCPVDVVFAQNDVFVGRDDASRLARMIAGARTTVVPGTGHYVHVERPAVVIRALLREVHSNPVGR